VEAAANCVPCVSDAGADSADDVDCERAGVRDHCVCGLHLAMGKFNRRDWLLYTLSVLFLARFIYVAGRRSRV